MRRLTSRRGWPVTSISWARSLASSWSWCQREKPVGPLYLDILAKKAGTDVLVAIENQLEWTDTHHLGQLLTYATGCNAPIAIWVASGFTHEYAKALHLLNEWTKDEISFYGVKVEVIKRTEPLVPGAEAPEGGLSRLLGQRRHVCRLDPPMPPQVQKHHDFFRPLIGELKRSGFADKAVQTLWPRRPVLSLPPQPGCRIRGIPRGERMTPG